MTTDCTDDAEDCENKILISVIRYLQTPNKLHMLVFVTTLRHVFFLYFRISVCVCDDLSTDEEIGESMKKRSTSFQSLEENKRPFGEIGSGFIGKRPFGEVGSGFIGKRPFGEVGSGFIGKRSSEAD